MWGQGEYSMNECLRLFSRVMSCVCGRQGVGLLLFSQALWLWCMLRDSLEVSHLLVLPVISLGSPVRQPLSRHLTDKAGQAEFSDGTEFSQLMSVDLEIMAWRANLRACLLSPGTA